MHKFLVAVMCDASVIGDGSVYVILNEVRHSYSIFTCYHDDSVVMVCDSVVMVMHVTMVLLILNSRNQLPW